MKKYTLLLLFLANFAYAKDLQYQYDKPITLTGTLITQKGLDPDEHKISFPAIKLNQPITVLKDKTDTDGFSVTERGVKVLQLAMGEKQWKDFNRLKNHGASVKGTLYHSDNGHHYTKVLINVDTIE